MQASTVKGLTLLQFENLAETRALLHAVTTRTGGVSPPPFHSLNLGIDPFDSAENVRSNYERLARALDFDLQCVVSSRQVHGTAIAVVDRLAPRQHPFPYGHALDGYDGFITCLTGVTLVVRVADCVPLVLYEPDKKVLGIVHAGWRGTAGGIAAKAAQMLVDRFSCDAALIRAGIGPSIGPCCYEVHAEVAMRLREKTPEGRSFIFDEGNGVFSVDLQEANRLQLLGAGLTEPHIEVSRYCTACNRDLFFSHRGEKGKTGRFALVAGLRP